MTFEDILPIRVSDKNSAPRSPSRQECQEKLFYLGALGFLASLARVLVEANGCEEFRSRDRVRIPPTVLFQACPAARPI
ncbi:MAG TPA: hypothetical protein VFE47_02035 [Tepidisphaeraceae bacterium]|nr:hypothetical protein [Tepidisphaeraceae bacterium]